MFWSTAAEVLLVTVPVGFWAAVEGVVVAVMLGDMIDFS
jgi:hypothetical protein